MVLGRIGALADARCAPTLYSLAREGLGALAEDALCRRCQTSHRLALLFAAHDPLPQGVKLLFDGGIEQRIFPAGQSRVYRRPIFRLQRPERRWKKIAFFPFHMLPLECDEVANRVIERLARNFVLNQDPVNDFGEPVQPIGYLPMLGFDVPNGLANGRIARYQCPIDYVLFRMMASGGMILEVIDDKQQNLIIWPLKLVEYPQFSFENQEYFFYVPMLFL
jgi:hypothetical protein